MKTITTPLLLIWGLFFSVNLPEKTATGEVVEDIVRGSECGLYAVYVAAASLGHKASEEFLASNDFVSSADGSSIADIERAIDSLGLGCRAFKGLTATSLRYADGPVIFYVKSDKSTECGGHWLTYLGEMDGGDALVFDVSNPSRISEMSYGELDVFMTGEGVFVFQGAPTVWKIWKVFIGSLAPLISLLALAVLMLALLGRPLARYNKSVQTMAMVLISFSLVALYQSNSVSSFWHNPGVVAWVVSSHDDSDRLPEVSIEHVYSWLGRENVVFVDARSKELYDYGHIPGARNLPHNAGPSEIRRFSSKFDGNVTFVVYCINADCNWADRVARRLKTVGFNDVRVFRSGLQGFVEHRQKPYDSF